MSLMKLFIHLQNKDYKQTIITTVVFTRHVNLTTHRIGRQSCGGGRTFYTEKLVDKMLVKNTYVTIWYTTVNSVSFTSNI